MMRRLTAVGCLAVLCSGLGAYAQPTTEGLFRDIDDPRPDIATPQPGQPDGNPRYLPSSTLRSRLVRIDVRALAGVRQGTLSPDGNARTLNLFDDAMFEVVFEKSVPAGSGYALQGRLLGVESGNATFVVRGRTVTGTVTTPDARYTIIPAGDDTHVLAEVDWTLAPVGEPVPPDDSPDEPLDESTGTTPVQRAIPRQSDGPAIPANLFPTSTKPPLPNVNSNSWHPEGPGAAARAGGLFDGQVENVEPNNAVIGAIHTVLAHPTDADILYIGATNGGVWKTTNATATNPFWTPLTDDMGSTSIGAMAFDPNDPETILVGIGRYSSFGRRGGDRNGLFLTEDGGESWTKLDDPLLVEMNVSGLSINGDRLVVAGNGYTVSEGHRGVARSEDGGETWTAVVEADGIPEGRGVFDMVDDPSDSDRLYASVQYNGIFRSDDGGATWVHASENDEAIQAVMTHGFNNNAEMAVAHDGRLYLAAMIGGQAQYIGHTDDQGGTWTEMDLPQTPESDGDIEGLNPRFKAGAQGYIHFSIRVDPDDANTVYVGGDRQDAPFPNFIGARDYTGRLFRGNASVEPTGGVPSPQWDHLTHSAFVADIPGGGTSNNSAPHADSREMVFDADGDLIQVDDGGIYRRTSPGDNTGDWFSLNGNLQITEMHDVAYDTLANVIVSGNQDVGNAQQTAGASLYWDTLTGADGGDVVIDVREAEGRSVRYLSNQYFRNFTGHVYDAANERIDLFVPNLLVNGSIRLSEWEPSLQFVQRFELNAVNPNRVVLGASALYESYDQFETLEEAFYFLDPVLDPYDQVHATAYGCADDPDLLYVGRGWWQGPRIDVRASSVSASNNFAQTAYEGGYPVDILINSDACATVYVIDTQRVWASDDTGETWQDVTGNLEVETDPDDEPDGESQPDDDGRVRYRDLRKLEFIPAGEIFANAAIAVAGRGGVQVMDVTAPGEWYDLGSDLPDAPVFDLDYDLDDRLLVAGTLGRGAWRILSSAPLTLIGIADQDLEVDDEPTLDISSLFHSKDELTYSVSSSDASVVAVSLSGTDLTISANKTGAVTITVVATDDDGLMGTYSFSVTVGTVVTFAAQTESAPEGGTLTLAIDLNRTSATDIDVDYTVVPGDATGTADADANDHDTTAGTLSFAAGTTRQEIEVNILQDDDIEPVREAFTIKLGAPGSEDSWGLGLVPDATVQIEEGVCDRTAVIRDLLRRHASCSEVAEFDLASFRHLGLNSLDIAALKPRDLEGLAGLARLEIMDNPLAALPAGLFNGLTGLVTLEVVRNRLEALPGGIFDDLARLKTLDLRENALATLPADLFQGAPALEHLNMTGNALAALPDDVFAGLHGLKVLLLGTNQLAALPPGIFDPLTELEILDLAENQLAALPSGTFDPSTELEILDLAENQLATLPSGIFDPLTELEILDLAENQLTALSDGVFDGLTKMSALSLDRNQLASLPEGVFDGATDLGALRLNDNQLTELPAGVFSGLEVLASLHLDRNELTALPAGVFENVTSLTLLHLQDNPGAPFPLKVQPVRTDSTELNDPGPATLEATVVEGAPFAMSARLAVANGSLSADRPEVAAGQTASESFTVTEDNGKAIVEVTEVSGLPATGCGEHGACFQGIETVAGDSVVLFKGPQVASTIGDQALESVDDSLVFDLSDIFSAEDGTTLTFSVVSSDPAIAAVSLDGSVLTITAADEGDATITITATDDLGRIATLEFDVSIVVPRGGFRGWRLGVLAEQANAAEEDGEADPL